MTLKNLLVNRFHIKTQVSVTGPLGLLCIFWESLVITTHFIRKVVLTQNIHMTSGLL